MERGAVTDRNSVRGTTGRGWIFSPMGCSVMGAHGSGACATLGVGSRPRARPRSVTLRSLSISCALLWMPVETSLSVQYRHGCSMQSFKTRHLHYGILVAARRYDRVHGGSPLSNFAARADRGLRGCTGPQGKGGPFRVNRPSIS